MIRQLAWIVPLFASLSAHAFAQENRDVVDLTMVWYSHGDCVEPEPGTPGSTPETAIDVEFDAPYYTSAREDFDDVNKDTDKYDCRFVRMSGYMMWTDYYHYRGYLRGGAAHTYGGDEVSYVVENFVDGSPPRSDLMRRQMTVVGRFYNLCAAADRAQREANQRWGMLFGPCHYGINNGMMLSDVRVEKVHDNEPRYLLGDANRAVIGAIRPATDAEHREVEPVLKAWATAVQSGLGAIATQTIAHYPASDDDDIKSTRERIESADSYESYLLNRRNFARLDLRTAPIQIFRATGSEEFDTAIGCICLEKSCTDRWPIIEDDASEFLGAAACMSFDRDDASSPWRW